MLFSFFFFFFFFGVACRTDSLVLLRHEVLVPLVSWRGSHLGCLCLGATQTTEDGAVNETTEIMKLEVLASDLAVTIENARLHHQLVRSEKLAGLAVASWRESRTNSIIP